MLSEIFRFETLRRRGGVFQCIKSSYYISERPSTKLHILSGDEPFVIEIRKQTHS